MVRVDRFGLVDRCRLWLKNASRGKLLFTGAIDIGVPPPLHPLERKDDHPDGEKKSSLEDSDVISYF